MKKVSAFVLLSIIVFFGATSLADASNSYAPEIELSSTSLNFGQVFEGTTLLKKISLVNSGNETLTLGPLSSSSEDFYVFYTGGSDVGGIDISPGDSINIFVVYEANSLGESTGEISITSSIPTVFFTVTGIGVTPPVASINPDSLSEEINSGDIVDRTITISNSGGADLDYSLGIQFATTSELISESKVFNNVGPIQTNKTVSLNPRLFTTPQQRYVTPAEFRQRPFLENITLNNGFDPELEEILVNIDEGLQGIADLIQDRYNFSEGQNGSYISDGGGDMYDGGNFLNIDESYNLEYSDLTINSTAGFGSEVSYFTSKKDGIFTFVGDLEGANSFEIVGGLGADGGGSVKGASFEIIISGQKFTAYTKQVYNAGDPSVNHIIIVEDGEGTSQQFSTSTNEDYHQIYDLDDNTRIYYILFAGNNGKEFTSQEMETIATSYLNLFSFTPPYLIITEDNLSGSIVSGSEVDIPIKINASGLIDSTYTAEVVVSTNDPALQNTTIPVVVKVNGAPGIVVNPNGLDFENLFVGAVDSIQIDILNGGTDVLEVSNIVFSNTSFSFSKGVNLPLLLAPGESINRMIVFAPTSVQDATSTLSLTSNDPNNAIFEVPVVGFGVNPPIISLDTDSLFFSLNSGDSLESNFQINNTGESDLFYKIDLKSSSQAFTGEESSESVLGLTSDYDPSINDYASFILEYSLLDGSIIDTVFSKRINYAEIDALARNGNKLFFHEPGSFNRIYILNIESGIIESELILPSDVFIYSLAHSGKNLFGIIQDEGQNDIYLVEIDKETGAFTDTLEATSAFDPSFLTVTVNVAENKLYTSANSSGIIRVYDLETREELPNLINHNGLIFYNLSFSSSRNSLIAFGYDQFSGQSYQFFELDPEDGTITRSVELEANNFITDLAADEVQGIDYLSTNSPLEDTLTVGGAKDFNFKINTAGMLGGVYNSEFDIKSNDPLTPELRLPMSLTVVGIPEISLNEDTLIYGELFTGLSKTLEINIENSGTDQLEISAINFSGTQFSLVEGGSFPMLIEPFKSKKVQVSFNPTSAGEISNILTIQSNASTLPAYEVTLLGVGIEPPVIVLSENELSYSANAGDSVAGSFVISNDGNSPLFINTSASTGRSLTEHRKKIDPRVPVAEAASIQSNSRLFGLTLNTGNGTYIAEFSLQDGSIIDSTFIVNDSGVGPEGLAYDGEFIYYFTSVYNSMIFKVNPDRNADVDTLFIQNSNFDALGHSGKFLYALDHTQDLIVKIDPETGEFVSTLVFGDEYDLVGGLSFGGSRGTIFVSAGEGPVLEINSETGEIINDVINPTSGFKAGLGYSDISGTLWISALDTENDNNETLFEINPDNGQIIKKFPIKASIYALASNETTNPGFLKFLTAPTDTIGAGDELIFDFELNATNLFGGIYDIEFTISSNDPVNPLLTIPLEFEVIGTPELTFDSDTLDFGKQIIGKDYTRYITFKNTGTDDVTISKLSVTEGNFFTVSEDTSITIPPIQSIQYPVSFSSATVTGKFQGLFEFKTNGLESGEGTIPLIVEVINGPAIEFEKQDVQIEISQGEVVNTEFKVSNTGDSTLVLNLKALNGLSSETQSQPAINQSKDILVIENEFSWNISATNVIEDEFPNHTLTTIQSSELVNQGLDESDFIVTVGGQDDSYYSDLSTNQNRLEQYIEQGGVMLYSASTFGSSINIAGGTVSVFENEFHQTIMNENHPILDGLVDENFTSISNNNVLRYIPDNAEVSLIGRESREPTFIEYELGKGYVVVSSVAIEYLHNRNEVIFEMQDFYLKTLRYVDSIILGPSWIEMNASSIKIAPGEEVTISININASDLELGEHKAHIIADSNLPDGSEVVLADIDLTVTMSTSLEPGDDIPNKLELSQNYPNPFNPSTNIAYGLPEAGKVQIKVYNILGQQVLTLVDDFKKAGRYNATFDAGQLSSGVYFYRMTVDGQELEIKKMLLLK